MSSGPPASDKLQAPGGIEQDERLVEESALKVWPETTSAPPSRQLAQQPAIVERSWPRRCSPWPCDSAAQSFETRSITHRDCHTCVKPSARDIEAAWLRSCEKLCGIDAITRPQQALHSLRLGGVATCTDAAACAASTGEQRRDPSDA